MKIKRKKIFISRDLEPDSCLHQLSPQFELIAFSLLKVNFLELKNIPDTHWYFFYSKNGVKSFYENAKRLNFKFDTNHKIATIGESTASLFSELFLKDIDCICNDMTDTELYNVIGNQTITFVQARESLQRYQHLFDENSMHILISYTTDIKEMLPKFEADYYIFTSPKNVKAFFEYNTISKTANVISIGKTTAEELSNNGVLRVNIPPLPSEALLLSIIGELHGT